MNRYVKNFLHRGLVFGGFGPVICGIIFFIISLNDSRFSLDGKQILIAILSTYILAFTHAGASVFNQIEEWPVAKSLLFHLGSLYIAYICCYIINSWIPFDFTGILIFTAIFLIIYFTVWTIVVIAIKSASKKLNKSLK